MSLPPAQKDISDHPASGSVVDPVNKRLKDADVDRKIRFYGVVEAFRQGRMPDNKQIDESLTYLNDNSPLDLEKLSPDGRKLVQDSRDIIETARLIVKEKNSDELFQNFVWHTRDVSLEGAKKDPSEVAPIDQQKARDDGQQAVRHVRTILSLIMTNSEVRKLLSDFSVIGRDLLAKGAAKAAENLRPGEEALSRVDEPAPQDEFITKGNRKVGPNETPVLEARVPGTDTTIEQHPRADDAKVTTGEGEEKSGSQVLGEGRNATQGLKDQAIDSAKDGANQAKDQTQDTIGQQASQAQQQGNLNGVGSDVSSDDIEAKKQSIMDRMRGVRDGFSDRVPQQHRDRVNDHYERGKKFFTEEYFPEERRDQFIYRGKKVIIECQKHDDYQGAIKWLLSYAEEYANHGKTMAGHGKESGGSLTSDPSLRQATSELRTLLERFANGKNMNIIFDSVNALVDDARRDEEFRAWFRRLDAFIRKLLLQAGYVLEEDCNREGNEVRESGRQFWDQKYRGHFDNLFNSTGNWFAAMGDDPLNKRFGEDWARLTRDLLFDSEGSLKFKPELWSDIRKVILPTLVDKIGYVPIPRIEYTDDSLDLVVENLTLQGRNLFPNYMSMEAHNFLKFSPYNAITDEHHHEFTLTFGQMQADMRDVAFYFRKKTGIPKLSDSGLADVVLGGEGLTATVHLVSADKDRTSVFKVKNVHVKVDTLKFSIRDSKHDLLYKTVKPLATGLVKKQIQKAIADAITTGMEYVDGQLVSVRDRMEEAKSSDETNRKQVLQDMFKRQKDESQQSTKSDKPASQFKVVHNKRASVIATGHPAGWVNRTTEREEKAMIGKDWRSEASLLYNAETLFL
ncbi:hypothetical protein SERLA73DRAFT_115180 [Serpula lacrymans var. lacrymans S7.3]|uniref:Uncharacterized protein n=2 Tax=Serpula lacrymans var. lacrymans TaxID=341189 RepID=F8QCA4_SERL3|nr:uncharacterized protein SERLADRAFT_453660 [Serpula lacrymans var. lacrymans S7.9]EGN94223.1 hypothetical protein SERLA73DRAFT_115180 [Serpula lacrymans var. lacrymans S7.3]EGO19714.1 hypothetical protein SERLADRAFT_453660 [Serpula lacrymans var. lacrymans S7.9]